jgi:chromosome segregation ATPase
MVVSGVAAVLLVVASATGYLWWATATELSETRIELTAEVDELTGTIQENDAEIGRLTDELQGVEDQLGEAETQLEGTRNMVDQLEDEQGVIRRCITLSRQAQEAVLNDDQAAFNAVIDEATDACAEADAILGF